MGEASASMVVLYVVLLMKEEVPNDKFAKKINSLQKIPLLKVQKFAS